MSQETNCYLRILGQQFTAAVPDAVQSVRGTLAMDRPWWNEDEAERRRMHDLPLRSRMNALFTVFFRIFVVVFYPVQKDSRNRSSEGSAERFLFSEIPVRITDMW